MKFFNDKNPTHQNKNHNRNLTIKFIFGNAVFIALCFYIDVLPLVLLSFFANVVKNAFTCFEAELGYMTLVELFLRVLINLWIKAFPYAKVIDFCFLHFIVVRHTFNIFLFFLYIEVVLIFFKTITTV